MKALEDQLQRRVEDWDPRSRLVYVAAPFAAPTAALEALNAADARQLGRIVESLGWYPVVPHRLGYSDRDLNGDPSPECRARALAATMEVMRAVMGMGGLLAVLLEADAGTRSSGVLGEIGAWLNGSRIPPVWVTRPMLARRSTMTITDARGSSITVGAPCRTCGGAGRILCHPERLSMAGGRPRCLVCEHGDRVDRKSVV